MPMAVPLVASAFSISAGLTAGGLLGGLMVAGGALTGLGALTGNSRLSKLGSVLGLVGGVGSLATTALETAGGDAAAKAMGEAAAQGTGGAEYALAERSASGVAGQGVTEAARNAATTAKQGLASLGDSVKTAEAAFGSGGGGLADKAAEAAGAAGSGSGGGLIAGQMGATPSDLALQAGTKAANASPSFWDSLSNGVSSNAAGDVLTGAKNTLGTIWDAAGSAVKGAGQWAEANPNTAKLAGGMIGGAMQYMGQVQAQRDAVQQRMRYEDWVRQRYNDSLRNLRVPSPVSTQPGGTGIIAGSRG